MPPVYDVVIIGAGPTGINCGIEAHKAGLSYIILEKGLLVNSLYHFPTNMTFFSTSVNLEIGGIPFISHNDKPTRKEALEYYRRLSAHYKLNIQYDTEVISARSVENINEIVSSRGTVLAKYIIVATGFYDQPRMLEIPGEALPKVKHYYDDPHPYIGRNIVVVGGANSACDVALETWQSGANVTMVVRDKSLYEKVKYWILPNIKNRIKEGSIKAFFSSTITHIHPDQVDIQTPDGLVNIKNDYVLAMTGYMPDFPLLERLGIKIASDDNRIPVHNLETLKTENPNIYVAGVVNGGMKTSKYFIENTRHHAKLIIDQIAS